MRPPNEVESFIKLAIATPEFAAGDPLALPTVVEPGKVGNLPDATRF